MEDFDSKKENLAYTIGIIKPKTSQSIDKINEIVKKIEEEGFIIKDIIKKILTVEEIMNVFYKQKSQGHYKEIKKYMLSGESTILLLCNEKEDPIEKWKKMIGNKDPVEAKKEGENLRAIYGESIIKNELHGSDDVFDSNKERDTFRFRIPQKEPQFKYDNFKLDWGKIMKWLYPVNQEHPSVNQRLDILAVYGPVIDGHSVDKCYCIPCSRIAKQYLANLKQNRIENNQVSLPPLRLIDEIGQQQLSDQMCSSCVSHCNQIVHLPSGRQGLHLMTDAELKLLGEELNRKELLELLRIEKGKAADIMMNQINVQGDKRVEHDRQTLITLFNSLSTDYYGRYSFNALQNLVLEDRRIRMVKWVSMIVEKPVHRFSNPKMFDTTIDPSKRHDPNSIHFSLKRSLPLSMTIKANNPAYTAIDNPPSILDYNKLMQGQVAEARRKRNHKYSHKAVDISEVNKPKDYQDGRHGHWDNYVCLKGQNKGSYVQTKQ